MGDAFISAKLNLLSYRHDLIYPVELDAGLVVRIDGTRGGELGLFQISKIN